MWIAREIAWLSVLAVGFGFSALELHSDIAHISPPVLSPVLKVIKGVIVIKGSIPIDCSWA